MTDQHYPMNLFWSDEDACWIAAFPDLRGCSAWGNTREEAVKEAGIALELWLEAMHDLGHPVPPPSVYEQRAA